MKDLEWRLDNDQVFRAGYLCALGEGLSRDDEDEMRHRKAWRAGFKAAGGEPFDESDRRDDE